MDELLTITKKKKRILVLTFFVAGLLTWLYIGDQTRLNDPAVITTVISTTNAVSEVPMPVIEPVLEEELVLDADPIACKEFPRENAPTFARHEYELYVSSQIGGPQIQAYRSWEKPDVRRMADQGDSAAMVILALMEAYEAYGIPPNPLEETTGLRGRFGERKDHEDFSPEELAHQEASAYWFYQAALHGRLMALNNYGWVVGGSGLNAVEMGWATQQEYDQLTSAERAYIKPGRIYVTLVRDIAPGLSAGPLGEDRPPIQRDHELALRIRERLLGEFHDALIAQNLPIPEVATASFPLYEELNSRRCEIPSDPK